jgi:PAS domain S-box-containing protein
MLDDVSAAPPTLAECELLRAVLRALDEPLMLTRTSLHPDGRGIVFTNAAFQHLVGRTEEELLDASPEILLGEDRTTFERMYEHALRGEKVTGEVAIVRKDGSAFVNAFAIYPIMDASGRATFVASVHSDVTARRLAEKRRAELEESVLESEKMAALGAVAAGVAHQVRNRLFGITATFDAFEARFGEGAGVPAFLSVIRDDLSRLTALMRDLMEYGSPPSLTFARGELGRAVTDAVIATRGMAEAARVTVRASSPPSDDAVAMDAERLAHAFGKLIENAIGRSASGGEVTVDVERRGHELVVRVRDSGKPVRDDDLPRVFEPFFRDKSAGLGLAIAHRIIEAHGGVALARNVDDGFEIAVAVRGAEAT